MFDIFVRNQIFLIFSAPANLRYGDSPNNSGIRENFDPMGDGNGGLTLKETKWLNKFAKSGLTVTTTFGSQNQELVCSSTGNKKEGKGTVIEVPGIGIFMANLMP